MTLQNRLVASLCMLFIIRALSQYNGDFVLGNIPVPEEGWLDKDLHMGVLYTQTQHSPAHLTVYFSQLRYTNVSVVVVMFFMFFAFHRLPHR